MEHIKELLVNKIEQQAHFRREKSEQFPDDHRNFRSATNLDELKKHVDALPADHPLFKTFQNHDESELVDFNYHLSRFGFNGDQDPETFVAWVVNGMKIVYSGSE